MLPDHFKEDKDARSVLQALFRPHASGSTLSTPPSGKVQDSLEPLSPTDDLEEPSALQRYREEIRGVLRRPVKNGHLHDIEARVARFLEKLPQTSHKVSPIFNPPTRTRCVNAAVQSEVTPIVPDLASLPPERPAPVQRVRRLGPLSLVLKDSDPRVASLQKCVDETRQRLEKLDKQTSNLKQQLRDAWSDLWDQQRSRSRVEAQMQTIFKEKEKVLPPGALEEDEGLAKEEGNFNEEVQRIRNLTARFASMAKQHDGVLEHDRHRQHNRMQALIAKHPAGEVFLHLSYDSLLDDISDDSDGRDGGSWTNGHIQDDMNDEVVLADSEDDDDEYCNDDRHGADLFDNREGLGMQDRSPPPLPGQRWRVPLRNSEEDGGDSSQASMSSHSNDRYGGPLDSERVDMVENGGRRRSLGPEENCGISESSSDEDHAPAANIDSWHKAFGISPLRPLRQWDTHDYDDDFVDDVLTSRSC